MIFVPVVLILVVVGTPWLWTPDKSRTELKARYLNAPGDLLDVAGVQLHVRDSGPQDAPVVILIHGFGSSLHTWEPWAKALSAEHRVIRFDLPGSGLSQPDPIGDYTDARSLQLLIALMDGLGVRRATLIGNSIGGRIARCVANHGKAYWSFAPRRRNLFAERRRVLSVLCMQSTKNKFVRTASARTFGGSRA